LKAVVRFWASSEIAGGKRPSPPDPLDQAPFDLLDQEIYDAAMKFVDGAKIIRTPLRGAATLPHLRAIA
jgi:hypothetical protein